MIIFDLICAHNHIFEGWFSSSRDYESQKEKRLLQCPTCGSEDIKKSVMAPNIGLKANQKKISAAQLNTAQHKEVETSVKQPKTEKSDTHINNQNEAALQEAAKALAKAQDTVLKESIWVGDRFSQEARSMHYGEADNRQIHGHATQKEARDLQEEGIEIAALPLPYIPPDLKN